MEWRYAGERRGFVGPPHEFDLIGAAQFALLYACGLREHHRLLDIGCGSLRGGRLFIAYLGPGGYTGIEPNRWLIEEALDQEIGRDLVKLKASSFLYNDSFDVTGLEPFDFVLAQSIASHTGPAMTRALLDSVRDALAPAGLALVTFIHGRSDSQREGWIYPGAVRYRRSTVARWIREAGLDGEPLRWYHPRQSWWALTHRGVPPPPSGLRRRARGSALPFKDSWTPLARQRQLIRKAWMQSGVRVWRGLRRRLARPRARS
jgi:SAM-dependent methyltransferase